MTPARRGDRDPAAPEEHQEPAPPMSPRERERRERAARRHELGRPELTEIELGHTTYKVAEVEPLDVDGVRTVAVGSGIWMVAFVALLPFIGTLHESGRVWWLWTCLAGFGLGLIGVEYCRRRRNALRLDPARRKTETSPFGPAGT
ncbi:MAG: DUF2530 domain-containing protein [Nocardioidaceae bacterium]